MFLLVLRTPYESLPNIIKCLRTMSFSPQHWQLQYHQHCLSGLEALQILQGLRTLEVSISFFTRECMKHNKTMRYLYFLMHTQLGRCKLSWSFMKFSVRSSRTSQATLVSDEKDLPLFLTSRSPYSAFLGRFLFGISTLHYRCFRSTGPYFGPVLFVNVFDETL